MSEDEPRSQEEPVKSEETKKVIKTFDFAMKRAVVLKSINKIIGTKTELKVAGFIPVYAQNAEFKTKYRNCWASKCWEVYIV